MLVKDWMSNKVIAVNVQDTLQHAIKLSMENQVSMMPVLEDGKLVGIITDRDLKRASPSDAVLMDVQHILYHLSRLEVGAVMSRHPITIPPDHTVEEAASVLLANKISGAPVVDENGEIKGTITKNDLFKAMISLSGLSKRGVQFGLVLEDRAGSIKEVTDIVRKYNARLVSILSSREKAPEGYRQVYIRAFNIDRAVLPKLTEEIKEALKDNSKLLYVVDHRDNKRKIYVE
jgi:acetoin utilization protein AcuB